jgi:hypothetical protein
MNSVAETLINVLRLLGVLMPAVASLGVVVWATIRRSSRLAAWLLCGASSLTFILAAAQTGSSLFAHFIFNRFGTHGFSWFFVCLNVLQWFLLVGVGVALALFRPARPREARNGRPS